MASRNRIRALHLVLQQSMGTEGTISDSRLLERFIAGRDEVAFELLVQRHQRLVYGVCQRILNDTHDAEDAFQATFLALARKAANIVNREAVSTWLYKVAYRVALTAKSSRPVRPKSLSVVDACARDSNVAAPLENREIASIIDDEMNRLPEPFRTTAILCHLEGKSVDEVAQLLGCPRGTVASRLVRARERLRLRLARRGVGLGVMALSAALTPTVNSAIVPSALIAVIVRAVCPAGAGAATVSNKVLTLTEEVIRNMFLKKLTHSMAILMLVATTVLIGGAWALRAGTNSGEPTQAAPKIAADDNATDAKDKPEPAGKLPQVTVQQVESKEIPRHVDFGARLEAGPQIAIVADRTGGITKVHFNIGDEVKKGDPLWTIGDALIDSDDLRKPGELSKETTQIVAPVAGKMTAVAGRGRGVRVGSNLGYMLPRDKIGVRFEMDEVSFLRYRKLQKDKEVPGVGDEVRVNLAAEKAGFSRKAILLRFESEFDPKTATLAVHAIMPDAEDLLPGMSATVRMAFGKPRPVLLVPTSALWQDEVTLPGAQRLKYVLVVNDRGVVEKRAIKNGTQIDDKYDITEGLRPGEWVVTQGAEKVKPGEKVEVKRAAAPKK